jgi:hypothetical protein
MKTPVAAFYCPTRRMAQGYPFGKPGSEVPYNAYWKNADKLLAKTDYAANEGGPGPGGNNWFDTGGPTSAAGITDKSATPNESRNMLGVIYQRSCLPVSQVKDGLSNTYMLGEKFVPTEQYTSGIYYADNGSCFTGVDKDIIRLTVPPWSPCQDFDAKGDQSVNNFSFGSAHAGGWCACFCDGSVQMMSYWIDPTVHSRLGTRNDQLPTTGKF